MRRMRDAYLAEAVRLYTQEKLTMKVIAAQLHVAPSTVRNILIDAGVELATHGPRRVPRCGECGRRLPKAKEKR